jgi:hypothetical protein
MLRREDQISEQIADVLRRENIQFDRNVSIGGVQPDFVVYSPDGRQFIVETKTWSNQPGFRKRAEHQAGLYEQEIGVDGAFLVLDNLLRSNISEGAVTLDKLVPALKKAFAEPSLGIRQQKPVDKSPRSHIFAAMPFAGRYDDVFFVAMSYAAEQIGSVCKRVDKVEFSGDIVVEIEKLIREARAVIIDLSESKPNVLYEAGYAHALNKPVVHICSTPLEDLPFDVAQWNTLPYAQGQTFGLKESLAKRLRAAVLD